jgi:phosphatidate cytidylyltransferase
VTRLLSGGVLLVLVGLAAWWAPPAGILAVVLLFVVIGAAEYAALSTALGARCAPLAVAIAAAIVCAAVSWPALGHFAGPVAGDAAVPAIMAITIAFGLVGIARGQISGDSLARVASPVFGALYLGLPLGAIVAVRALAGREAMILLVVAIVISDTAQFYTGRLLGRRPLAPALSPKKTIEGALGGLVIGSAATAAIAGWWWPPTPIGVRLAAGAALVVLGICGDLFESMVKRAAGVKDSGTLIPGHGGVLDRIDALLFAAPVYYAFVRYVFQPS